MSARPWTAAEHALLAELIVAGLAYSEVAVRLDRSLAAVTHRRCQFNLPCAAPETTAKRRAEAMVAVRASASYQERHRAGCRAAWESNPGRRELARNLAVQRDAMGHVRRVLAADPERARHRAEQLATANARTAARKMAWLPADYRERYFRMMPLLGVATAKAAIIAEIARDRARVARAAPYVSPYERLLAEVRDGTATVVELPVSRGARELAYSPIGCALA